MTRQTNSHLYIFCSDRPRNGKTLLARLFCGHLPNSGARPFHIFDTDSPEGDIVSYFPENCEIVDFSKTAGRVKLFDTVLAKPERCYIVDLDCTHLDDFFQTFTDIGFDQEAHKVGTDIVVYYVLDREEKSLQRIFNLSNSLKLAEFILVKNEHIEKRSRYDPSGDIAHSLERLRTVHLPTLTDDLLSILELEAFSLFEFMAGGGLFLPDDVRFELWSLLDFFYNQRSPDSRGYTHYL